MSERDIRIVVAENVKRYMKELNINSKQIGMAVGNSTITALLKQTSVNGCTVVSLQKIAEALGVKTIDLIEDWSDEG